jgi:hypothetical protein
MVRALYVRLQCSWSIGLVIQVILAVESIIFVSGCMFLPSLPRFCVLNFEGQGTNFRVSLGNSNLKDTTNEVRAVECRNMYTTSSCLNIYTDIVTYIYNFSAMFLTARLSETNYEAFPASVRHRIQLRRQQQRRTQDKARRC